MRVHNSTPSARAAPTNPAGSAIVNAIGRIRQVVRGENKVRHRYFVIVPGTADAQFLPYLWFQGLFGFPLRPQRPRLSLRRG